MISLAILFSQENAHLLVASAVLASSVASAVILYASPASLSFWVGADL